MKNMLSQTRSLDRLTRCSHLELKRVAISCSRLCVVPQCSKDSLGLIHPLSSRWKNLAFTGKCVIKPLNSRKHALGCQVTKDSIIPLQGIMLLSESGLCLMVIYHPMAALCLRVAVFVTRGLCSSWISA